MRVVNEVEASGTQMSDAYIWRSFDSANLTELELLQAIRAVGLDAGWASWTCSQSAGTYLFEMRDGNPGFWALVQVRSDTASVKVGKDRPGSRGGPPDIDDEGAFVCD